MRVIKEIQPLHDDNNKKLQWLHDENKILQANVVDANENKKEAKVVNKEAKCEITEK